MTMVTNTKHQSPDMVEYDEVIAVIANYPKAFASEKDMAQILTRKQQEIPHL